MVHETQPFLRYAQSIAIESSLLLFFLLFRAFAGGTIPTVFLISFALFSRAVKRTTGAMFAFFLELTATFLLHFLFLAHSRTISHTVVVFGEVRNGLETLSHYHGTHR